MVLRRQLAQEAPRGRPWIRLPRAIPWAWLRPEGSRPAATGPAAPGRAPVRHLPVWRRGWHGVLRWPALRWARLVVLGALAGAALAGVWRGAPPPGTGGRAARFRAAPGAAGAP